MTTEDPLLDRELIWEAFRRLGDRLARRSLVADVYAFAGAAMAHAYDARRATWDIDAVFEPHGGAPSTPWLLWDVRLLGHRPGRQRD
jgi:hypothetical protein